MNGAKRNKFLMGGVIHRPIARRLEHVCTISHQAAALDDGAIEPWTKPRYRGLMQEAKKFARSQNIPTNVAWRHLTADQRKNLLGMLKLPPDTPPGAWWLTEFEDRSSPRPGTDEVYFRTAADQAVPGPQVRRDHQLGWIAVAAVQGRHPPLADRLAGGELGLRLVDALRADSVEQQAGLGPRGGAGIPA